MKPTLYLGTRPVALLKFSFADLQITGEMQVPSGIRFTSLSNR